MAILVINCGSSSVKFAVFEQGSAEALVTGIVDQIGSANVGGSYKLNDGTKQKITCQVGADHTAVLAAILDALKADEALQNVAITAVGHRVVHGGEKFAEPVLIDADVLAGIRELSSLAPLHNPANADGIEAASTLFPGVPQVAVFDTAFHQTIPPHVFRYAVPDALYHEHNVRRYGFHGTSHDYVSAETIRKYDLDPVRAKVLVAHLGNGCSATAVVGGRSCDTTMGITPLEGLMMGTRSGNVDPNLHSYLAENTGMSLDEITEMLNKKSGFAGLSGISNDLRELAVAYEEGHGGARLAVEVFCFRLARELAGLTVSLDGVPDAIAFTGGIGENSKLVREKTVRYLKFLGCELDVARNEVNGGDSNGVISVEGSKGPLIAVVATNEELAIAEATAEVAQPEGN
ncbi:acetate/propionate family kinase [Sulfuriroseicoccus oceanibius]|uniref:Acetate kinase n=1 Tax=Sulfuriroseicoccus oceanibius TaxID=2707525 RepID=A0A6B3LCX3_9BACT|nr:acetate kinase [Sulfuriroseicoccus oceanibius]QQL45992.1 acetate kinase [Sulfuriroseicoccus oceanibius]